jgi:methylenetetrahydrofolate dehydrogenase (NADP+)/methenyltetrahydrofolate cyclohydrolase
METRIYKTKELSEKILAQTHEGSAAFEKEHGRKPCLAVVLVGDDPASGIYVRKKEETCRKFGLDARDYRLSPSEGFPKLRKLVQELNANQGVDGILVQSPLPKGWDERAIQALIDPAKDVDGFHPLNAGRLLIDAKDALEHGLPPCTPAGVIEILKEAGIEVAGKRAVIIGRSTIVGKPMAQMLQALDATVTVCHSRTQNLPELCAEADILVAAIGKARFVKGNFVKPGAVVIDVGINRELVDGKSKVVGDVDADSVRGTASFLTPVPNGVGPMTIALLLRNTLRAARNRLGSPANA